MPKQAIEETLRDEPCPNCGDVVLSDDIHECGECAACCLCYEAEDDAADARGE